MKRDSVYLDLVSLVGAMSVSEFLWRVRNNLYTVVGLPTLLAVEAVVLYGLSLSAASMAGVGAFFCFLSFMSLTYAWSIGRELSQTSAGARAESARISDHQGYADAMAVSLLMGVVAIECAIRMEGGLWGPTWLKLLHFTFVLLSVVSFLVARYVLTGLKNPTRHKVWVRILTASYSTALMMGVWLILIKFPIA